MIEVLSALVLVGVPGLPGNSAAIREIVSDSKLEPTAFYAYTLN